MCTWTSGIREGVLSQKGKRMTKGEDWIGRLAARGLCTVFFSTGLGGQKKKQKRSPVLRYCCCCCCVVFGARVITLHWPLWYLLRFSFLLASFPLLYSISSSKQMCTSPVCCHGSYDREGHLGCLSLSWNTINWPLYMCLCLYPVREPNQLPNPRAIECILS